jgi:thiamine biosynthesis protein ThiI
MHRDWDRLYVEPTDAATVDSLARPLQTISGIQALRPAYRIQWDDLDDIVEVTHRMWASALDDDIDTFAVRAQRVGDRDAYDFTSPEAAREIGSALDHPGVSVDLDNPELEVGVEIHADQIFVYAGELSGPGGLPVGVEGKALALISGGFDSAVAAQQMYRRGVDLDFVYFQMAGHSHRRGMREVLSRLTRTWAPGTEPALNIVDFRPVIADIQRHIPDAYRQLALKRSMYRAATRIALDERADTQALVTGEAIGQVSTQTLTNLVAIQSGLMIPVFRPIVGMNKEDIVDQARQIGIYEAAEQLPEPCALQGGRQATACSPDRLDDIVDALDSWVLRTVTERTERLAATDQPSPASDTIRLEHIPDDAVLVDVRSESEYEQWHPNDALHVPFDVALEQGAALPPDPTYVFYCEVGLKSAHIADRLRKKGINAYSFDGGLEDLKLELDISA